MEKFTFFWRGPFSQWHPSPFTIDGITYTCAEQWMMASKARFFGDKEAEKAIMTTNNPKEQKALGRTVKGFNEAEWNKVAKDFVYRGNLAKFKQNPALKKRLIETKGTTLVEASPVDVIWGIGLAENDPRANDRSQWRGTNWLGEILTQLREDLMLYNQQNTGIIP